MLSTNFKVMFYMTKCLSCYGWTFRRVYNVYFIKKTNLCKPVNKVM